jgi:hypothetical protein
MGVIHRRHIRLVQADMHGINVEERQWLRTQGVDRPEELPRRSHWYHPDGTSSIGPRDPHHLGLYRRKGFTLMPPDHHHPRTAAP